jgi:hypothetical protein
MSDQGKVQLFLAYFNAPSLLSQGDLEAFFPKNRTDCSSDNVHEFLSEIARALF